MLHLLTYIVLKSIIYGLFIVILKVLHGSGFINKLVIATWIVNILFVIYLYIHNPTMFIKFLIVEIDD